MPRFAFFDADETIIRLKSMMSFEDFWCRRHGFPEEAERFREDMRNMLAAGASRESVNRHYYTLFKGRSTDAVRAAAGDWFAWVQDTVADLFHPAVTERIRAHQGAGEEAVIVSGSFHDVLAPIAAKLGIRHILCTSLVADGGHFTGEIAGGPIIGAGKASALATFLAQHGGRAEECHAYGDDFSDRFMLAAVGHPVTVAGQPDMEAHARRQGWAILDPM